MLFHTMNKTAVLITQPHTTYYVTGFETLSPTEREVALVVIENKNYIITDARYAGLHSHRYSLIITRPGEGLFGAVEKLCRDHGITTLIYQSDNLTEHEVRALNKRGIPIKGEMHLYTKERSVKTSQEIEFIREACNIGDRALNSLVSTIQVGQTEKEIAWTLEKIIREELHAELAFDPIIAVDAHAAIPHYNTKRGEGIIQQSSVVLFDFGVKYNNYCSDITRMACVGKIPTDVANAYEHLLSAQECAIQTVSRCNNLCEIDNACRGRLIENGYPSFPHSTGHGIGLEVHEAPRIDAKSVDVKQTGHVFTIEPGIYLDGKWGMRLEDTVVVTSKGSAEPLTRYLKGLIHLQ